jgi:hypothetical protein
MTQKPYNHKYCCAKCGIRTDRKKYIKYRRKINKEWLKKYFKAIDIDTNFYTYVCHLCYSNKLLKFKSELIDEIYSDQKKIQDLTPIK